MPPNEPIAQDAALNLLRARFLLRDLAISRPDIDARPRGNPFNGPDGKPGSIIGKRRERPASVRSEVR